MNRMRLFFVAVVFLALPMGCSGSSHNPVLPINQGADQQLTGGTAESPLSQEYIWGYYSLCFDLENRKVEVIASRSVDFTANVVRFLNNDPQGLKVKSNGVIPGPGYVDIDMDITIKHPLSTHEYDGYDVRGIFIGNGSATLDYNADLIYPVSGTDQILLNADGYSRWFNPTEFPVPKIFGYIPGKLASKGYTGTATLNPYKYFGEALGAGDDLWGYFMTKSMNVGYFLAGTSNTRNYKLRFPTPTPGLKYGYVVTANWSGTKPEDHPSHAPEAVGLSVIDNSDMWFVDSSHRGGNLKLDISVFDWDAQLTGGVMHDYQIKVESNVLSALHSLTASEMTPTASGTHWFTYHVEVPADDITSADANEMWVVVEDSNADYTNPLGVPNSADGDYIAACFRYPLTVANEEPKGIQLTVPNGGEQWKVQGSGDITWTANGDIQNVKISLSLNSGVDYTYTIADSTPNDGTFTWDPIPMGALGANDRIKITDYDDSSVFDESDADFSVVLPTIEVTSPNGTECWTAGHEETITWTADPVIDDVTILLSLNSGADYTVTVVDSTPNDGEFMWDTIIGDFAGSTCRIKVEDADYPVQIFDESDADFEIALPGIQVLTPNGGEQWMTGSTQEITWDSDPAIENVYIALSLNSGGDYSYALAGPIPSTGSWEWDSISSTYVSANCRIRVTSAEIPQVFDESDADFEVYEPWMHVSSPNGGEHWQEGSSHWITWECSETGGIVSIVYSKDDFGSDIHVIVPETPNDGDYWWDGIPSDTSSTVKVGVSLNGSSPVIKDASDDYFSILPPPSITVLTPNGGEVLKAGHSFEITWTSINTSEWVNIYYSKDGFLSDVNLIVSGTDNDSSYMWDPIPLDPSDTVRIKVESSVDTFIYDISDADFTLADSGWARTWGASGYDVSYGLTVDGSGNSYVTGQFQDTVDFDPSVAGVNSHTSNGGYDIFLSKFDPLGNFLWARTWGGSDDDQGTSVAVDGSGYVYVTGGFEGTVDFDPGTGDDSHISNGGYDIFLSKFTSAGNFLWARTWGGLYTDSGCGVAVHGSNSVYVTGFFMAKVDFDPGAGVDEHTSNGKADISLSKFDSSGNLLWADTWGGSDADLCMGVAVDGYDCAYVTGGFRDTVDFDPGSGIEEHTSNGDSDISLSKIDSTGSYVAATNWGGSYFDLGRGVAVDAWNNVYVAGVYESTVDFYPGGGGDIHTSNGEYDAFLSKFDSNLLYKWSRTWGGSFSEDCTGAAVDALGNVFVTGNFIDTVDFDPSGGVDSHISNGDVDAFLSKFDSSGYFQWAQTWGGLGWDDGHGVAVDGSGNAYVTGFFTYTVDFDPGAGFDYHTSINFYDVFLSRFLPDGNW